LVANRDLVPSQGELCNTSPSIECEAAVPVLPRPIRCDDVLPIDGRGEAADGGDPEKAREGDN